MSSFISGIIDCVARPSTSDSPVRILKKAPKSDSPTSVAHALPSSDSDSTVGSTPLAAVPSTSSFISSSRFITPVEATAVYPVSIPESVITIPNGNDDDDCDDISSNSADQAIRQQFESAFATFLYKNPAFTSMSHTNLTKLRSKISKETANNARVEAELSRQLETIRESKRRTELELQRELLIVTRAKAAREFELRNKIRKARQVSMSLDEKIQLLKGRIDGGENDSPSRMSGSSLQPPPAMSSCDSIGGGGMYNCSDLFPNTMSTESGTFQSDLHQSRMQYAHLLAEMHKLKVKIAETGSLS
eukprot:g12170.t1 g12170   contig6:1365910-1366821(-)